MIELPLLPPQFLFLSTGLILLSLVLRYSPAARDLVQFRLDSAQGRLALVIPAVRHMPDPDDADAIAREVRLLVQARDWANLGTLLAELDGNYGTLSDGRNDVDAAIDAALEPLERAGNLLTLARRLDLFRAAAASGAEPLVILHARALSLAIRRAERTQGRAGRVQAFHWAREIDELVRGLELTQSVPPSLGEAIYHASALLSHGREALDRAHRFWQAVDPGNIRAYLHHADRLARRGVEADEDLRKHLERTAAASAALGGPRLILQAQLLVAETRPLAEVPGFDTMLLHWQLGQVAGGPGGQAIVNGFAAQLLANGDAPGARTILRELMTHWVQPYWPDHRAFFAFYWRNMSGRFVKTKLNKAPAWPPVRIGPRAA